MKQNLEDTIALLGRTPGALDALLRDLPEAWTIENEGENTWNVADVLRHLVYVERKDWIARARTLRDGGEIGRVDREAHVPEPPKGSLGELLEEFARLRRENLKELGSWKLTDEDLSRRGNHKAFGEVTLSQLLATWAVHDLTHLHQISRILAHQYREAVGPWIAYLGVLKCDGHSAQ
ncbi:MAG TPA: DinB family protein [Candidatus Acidoferrum sp.]|nr:DinB family protein [Candidatus Acidoferrum sp.]